MITTIGEKNKTEAKKALEKYKGKMFCICHEKLVKLDEIKLKGNFDRELLDVDSDYEILDHEEVEK